MNTSSPFEIERALSLIAAGAHEAMRIDEGGVQQLMAEDGLTRDEAIRRMVIEQLRSAPVESLRVVDQEFCGHVGHCAACGSRVERYTANAAIVARRPEAAGDEYWAACSNLACKHAYGEGYGMGDPAWCVN